MAQLVGKRLDGSERRGLRDVRPRVVVVIDRVPVRVHHAKIDGTLDQVLIAQLDIRARGQARVHKDAQMLGVGSVGESERPVCRPAWALDMAIVHGEIGLPPAISPLVGEGILAPRSQDNIVRRLERIAASRLPGILGRLAAAPRLVPHEEVVHGELTEELQPVERHDGSAQGHHDVGEAGRVGIVEERGWENIEEAGDLAANHGHLGHAEAEPVPEPRLHLMIGVHLDRFHLGDEIVVVDGVPGVDTVVPRVVGIPEPVLDSRLGLVEEGRGGADDRCEAEIFAADGALHVVVILGLRVEKGVAEVAVAQARLEAPRRDPGILAAR